MMVTERVALMDLMASADLVFVLAFFQNQPFFFKCHIVNFDWLSNDAFLQTSFFLVFRAETLFGNEIGNGIHF